MAKTTKGGKWNAYLTNNKEVRVVEMEKSQPWGHPTKDAALKFIRPEVQRWGDKARGETRLYDAALADIDKMLEGS